MLWTLAKLDVVIKNYSSEWFQRQGSMTHSQSRQSITTRFGEEGMEFCHKLYNILIHAMGHVYKSLYGHIQVPMFTLPTYTVMSNHTVGDVNMEDAPSQLKGSKLA